MVWSLLCGGGRCRAKARRYIHTRSIFGEYLREAREIGRAGGTGAALLRSFEGAQASEDHFAEGRRIFAEHGGSEVSAGRARLLRG